jgi:hypothetical protein
MGIPDWHLEVSANMKVVPVRRCPYNDVQLSVMIDQGASLFGVTRYDCHPGGIEYRIRVHLSFRDEVATSLSGHQIHHLNNLVPPLSEY